MGENNRDSITEIMEAVDAQAAAQADAEVETPQFSVLSFLHPSLAWFHEPSSWDIHDPAGELEGSSGKHTISDFGNTLTLQPPARKDFWRKTFYTPTLVKSDASAFLGVVPLNVEATIGVDFEFTAVTQFDQAGLLVYIDDEHWIKCGVEFCDGQARLSVVVFNEYSDWSTQSWPSFGARLKVHKVLQSDSVVIEAAHLEASDYQFIRIAHLSAKSLRQAEPRLKGWQIGPYAASPIAQKGCFAKFSDFYIGAKERSAHSSEL
jgi:regulation of enolase protein 1 (concanavalin A-like superfamily)